MIPVIAQFSFDVNEALTTVGWVATVVVLVSVALVLIIRAITNRVIEITKSEAATKQADVDQQNSFTKMAMDNAGQIIKLHETIDNLNNKIIDMVEQRTSDREEMAVLRTKYEHSQELHSIELGLLKDQLNRMEKQYSKMQIDLNVSNADRDKLRDARDKLRDEIADLREYNAKLNAQNEAYKQQVQLAKTQPIPRLPIDENAVDPNTPTPSEAEAMLKELEADDAPKLVTPVDETKTTDNNDNEDNDDMEKLAS